MTTPLSNYRSSLSAQPSPPAQGKEEFPPDSLRVLHVSSGNLYGGVETLLATLARLRHLCPAMEPHFALSFEGRLSEELAAAGVPLYMLGKVRMSRPWTIWRARRSMRELVRNERFDIVICHMPWSLAVFGKAARARGQRLGFWAHGIHTGKSWVERLAARTPPDFALTNSECTSAALATIFPRLPAPVLHYPVALTESPEAGQWRAAVRKEQAVSDNTTVIIQVSRVEAWKGHVLHLTALSKLKADNRWVCWMVGGAQRPEEEQYLHRLRQTASELGIADRVRFLGQRADVPQLLAAADIFCQPNQEPEPFGIVFIEALWAGKPVVTTAMGGAREIIDDSCGFLVEAENPALLAASLRSLIEFPEWRMRLGRGGARRAQQLCDPATQMKSLSALCRGAASRHES